MLYEVITDIVQNEGVALDKIRIGNRERKVIVENFTNAMNSYNFV